MVCPETEAVVYSSKGGSFRRSSQRSTALLALGGRKGWAGAFLSYG